MFPLQTHFFQNAVDGHDQLRQRVAWALSQILVTSGVDVNLSNWMRPYQQLLYENAFGNYRMLLYEVSRNPAMGRYLDAVDNRCQTRTPPADPAECQAGVAVKPNENYAREFLQLFSVGADLLNADGTPVLDAEGVPVPAYDQATIEEYSRVFTGWRLATQFDVGVPNYQDPMRVQENWHDRGPKTLLGGYSIPAGTSTDEELAIATVTVMEHPNAAPFICKQLIQHLVTSNPSSQYVLDVANVFRAYSESPIQLQEVVRTILLHPEARTAPSDTHGRLKEPVLFMTGLLRALNAATDGALNSIVIGQTQVGSSQMSQNVFNAPTVFNYYSFQHQIPGTDPPLFGPQFEIHTSVNVVRRANFVNQLVFSTIAGTTVDFSPYLGDASDPNQLTAVLDQLLLHGSMSSEMRQELIPAIADIPESNPLLRVRQAVYLVATSPQYQVER